MKCFRMFLAVGVSLPQALQEKLWNMAVPLCLKQNVTATAAAQQVGTNTRRFHHTCDFSSV